MLELIRQEINTELASTDQFIIDRLDSHIPLINEVLEYVLNCGGKRVRPMVLILAARALAYDGHLHISLAAVIELIHTATLLHDDVVDNASLRRGQETANTRWNNNISVLVGDFLYSRAFQIVVDCKHPTILDIFAKATPYIAEGEILQLNNCHNPDTTEDYYFEIIKRKTATLFEVSAHIGATLANASIDDIAALQQYGAHLGLAYQLIDDALDYSQSAEETGKSLGQDLAEGKVTLPLIYALKHSNAEDCALLRQAIQHGTSENLLSLVKMIESTGAIQYTAERAKEEAKLAKSALSLIPPSNEREALMQLANFVVTRTY